MKTKTKKSVRGRKSKTKRTRVTAPVTARLSYFEQVVEARAARDLLLAKHQRLHSYVVDYGATDAAGIIQKIRHSVTPGTLDARASMVRQQLQEVTTALAKAEAQQAKITELHAVYFTLGTE